MRKMRLSWGINIGMAGNIDSWNIDRSIASKIDR
jgi:hypothetical protein